MSKLTKAQEKDILVARQHGKGGKRVKLKRPIIFSTGAFKKNNKWDKSKLDKSVRKVWWRKNWQLVLTMIFSSIVAFIFMYFVFWYMGEVNKMVLQVVTIPGK